MCFLYLNESFIVTFLLDLISESAHCSIRSEFAELRTARLRLSSLFGKLKECGVGHCAAYDSEGNVMAEMAVSSIEILMKGKLFIFITGNFIVAL